MANATNQDSPNGPTDDTLVLRDQRQIAEFQSLDSGLNGVRYWIKDIMPLQELATCIHVELHCDENVTPWCAF